MWIIVAKINKITQKNDDPDINATTIYPEQTFIHEMTPKLQNIPRCSAYSQK